MIYNFRIDREQRAEIIRRLREEKLLSQGWGGGADINLQLDMQVDMQDFVQKCKEFYDLRTTRIPSNLTRMQAFRNDDLLITPHIPKNGEVSIHIIDGDFPQCYDYLAPDPTHLNHRFRVKKSYGLDGQISIYNVKLASWYGKLPWHRLPVLPIVASESGFREIVNTLNENPNARFPKSSLDDFLQSRKSELLNRLQVQLGKMSASLGEISFEKVCEYILAFSGYEIERRNVHEGGGDIDLWCVRDRSDISPFESGQSVLFVQVKKHEGTTDEEAARQLLIMMEKDPTADGCVMSLADDFNEEAKKLAGENGILLMNGRAICSLLLQALAARQFDVES